MSRARMYIEVGVGVSPSQSSAISRTSFCDCDVLRAVLGSSACLPGKLTQRHLLPSAAYRVADLGFDPDRVLLRSVLVREGLRQMHLEAALV